LIEGRMCTISLTLMSGAIRIHAAMHASIFWYNPRRCAVSLEIIYGMCLGLVDYPVLSKWPRESYPCPRAMHPNYRLQKLFPSGRVKFRIQKSYFGL